MEHRTFRTSSFCTDAHGCVEVGVEHDLVQVRDAKEPAGARLSFTRAEWVAFVRGVKAGEFDF